MVESLVPNVEHVTYIDAPIERVYETLTTADGWDSSFTDGTTLDSTPGGRIRFRWVNFGADRVTVEDGGPVLEIEKNRKFVFQWRPGETTTTVSFELDKLGAGTLVRLQDSGYSIDDVETVIGCAVGWGEALMLLKFWLESGVRYGDVPAR